MRKQVIISGYVAGQYSTYYINYCKTFMFSVDEIKTNNWSE